jgi:acyl-coenzyme A synthetase/AMP-(fatty) acid ligase
MSMTTSSQSGMMSLAGLLRGSSGASGSFIQDPGQRIEWLNLLGGSVLYSRGNELQGRSVLVVVQSQLATVAALMELDGIAQRVILCPPDLSLEHLPYVIDTAQVDGIVTDQALTHLGSPRSLLFSALSQSILPRERDERVEQETEWILMTSGTTGLPKLVAHTLASLTTAIRPGNVRSPQVVWSTFYDIRRYGGLQVLLRAALTGSSLILADPAESTADFLARAAASGVTHISGTPSHWRRALMSPAARVLKPKYVRLSGEAIDQAVLNNLRSAYPEARIIHAFASTEAGVAFEVTDGLSGFPEDTLENDPSVEMHILDGTLRIRSAGAARCYLGDAAPLLKDQDGFVDTNDLLELRDGRYYFIGRRDGVINVGGLKVHPEQVEAVISRHPDVQMCVVRAQKSPITGALVVADVVLLKDCTPIEHDEALIQADILQICRELLPAHKVPAAINIVPALGLGGSGKVMRQNA